MHTRFLFLYMAFIFSVSFLKAQTAKQIVSGPMIGHTELRTSTIWAQFAGHLTKAALHYNNGSNKTVQFQLTGGEFNTAIVTLTDLNPGQIYPYQIYVNNGKTPVASGDITTQQLWQWRKPAPDFSFLTGSCAYFNEPKYDRPGKPYGGDSSIFQPMAKEEAAFTLWLGDNWYTREVDYFSEWGLHYRASLTRSLPVLKNLFKKMPHYAIWDDHDFGPNDACKSYILKNTSRNVFMKYWANPSYGQNGQGVYSKISWNDVDVFVLDDRWERSSGYLPDSINGQPNLTKKMFGNEQIEWLKEELLFSNGNPKTTFRIIATGSQVLNPFSPYDCMRHYPKEFYELLSFIEQNKIEGVLFLTGDRHHSEIIKQERNGLYPLYDITVSPFTSGIAKTRGAEANNPARIGKEIDEQNYARLSFSNEGENRKLTVTFISTKGNVIDEWSVKASDISK
ncbi:MAG: alkaline phosphatase D family protein [Ferruginibacter sp.]